MDYSVDYPRNGVHSSNNCTDADQKFDEIFLILSYVLGYRRKLEVKHQDRLAASLSFIVGHFVVWDQLVNVVLEQAFLEVAGDCYQVVHRFHLLDLSSCIGTWRTFDSVEGVLHVEVLKLLRNVVKILFVAEADVVDVVGVVKLAALHHERVGDVLVGVSGDVEVAWHSEHFDVASETTALTFVHFLFDALHNRASELVSVTLRFFRDSVSIFIQSYFVQCVTKHVLFVSSEDVLDVQWEDIAWHFVHGDVDVDVNEVISVREINYQISLWFIVHVLLDLKNG